MRYRLVYDRETKEIIMAQECTGTVTTTIHAMEEFDTEAEMNARIGELGLIEARQ